MLVCLDVNFIPPTWEGFEENAKPASVETRKTVTPGGPERGAKTIESVKTEMAVIFVSNSNLGPAITEWMVFVAKAPVLGCMFVLL